MADQEDAEREQRHKDLQNALENPEVPSYYFNGFVNSLGNGDITILLKRNERPVAILNASYTMAKTLAEKIGVLIAALEHYSGKTIMTTEHVSSVLKGEAEDDQL